MDQLASDGFLLFLDNEFFFQISTLLGAGVDQLTTDGFLHFFR
jgi:hypothetical protein